MFNKKIGDLARVVTVLSLLLFVSGSFAERENDADVAIELGKLATVEEFKGPERQRLLALPTSTVHVLIQEIQKAKSVQDETGYFSLLAIKVEQCWADISQQQKQTAIDLLISKCETAAGGTQRQRLFMISTLKDQRIDLLLRRLSAGADARTREAAGKVIQTRTEQQ